MAPQISLKQLQEKIINSATKDNDYRKRLFDNPKALLESEIGQPLPSYVEVVVLQEKFEQYYIVLPYQPTPGELSDAELEFVAGGKKQKQGLEGCRQTEQTTVVDIETKLA